MTKTSHFSDSPSLVLVPFPVNDRGFWNATLGSLSHHHILQSWEWGEFKEQYGWTAERLAFKRGDEVVAVAQVLTRRVRPLPLVVMYVPKGPALDYRDRPLRAAVLDALVVHARKRNAIFVKIDPDVVLGTGVPGESAAADASGETFQNDLEERGWSFSADQVQFRNTVQLDLKQDEGTLLAAMKQKTRYNIRSAGRKGVTVRQGSKADVELLFQMYAETAARDEFIIRPLAYYRNAWGVFMDADLSCSFIAEYEGEALAALILFCFGERVWYMYGASRDLHRDKMPNHRLQWDAICWAKANNYHIYDMWGAPDEFVESDPMWGVWRFKAGFGGRVVRHIGAWDMIISRPWHWLYTFAISRYLAFGRWLHKQKVTNVML